MLRFDLENENETVRNYRQRIRQAEALGEYALAEDLRQILVEEQDHQISLATALGIDVPAGGPGPPERQVHSARRLKEIADAPGEPTPEQPAERLPSGSAAGSAPRARSRARKFRRANLQVVGSLQVEPELRRNAEVALQAQGSVGRHRTLATDDLVDSPRRDVQIASPTDSG